MYLNRFSMFDLDQTNVRSFSHLCQHATKRQTRSHAPLSSFSKEEEDPGNEVDKLVREIGTNQIQNLCDVSSIFVITS